MKKANDLSIIKRSQWLSTKIGTVNTSKLEKITYREDLSNQEWEMLSSAFQNVEGFISLRTRGKKARLIGTVGSLIICL